MLTCVQCSVLIDSGWLLLKWSAIGLGFNGAKTICRIADILGILLMICFLFQRYHSVLYGFNLQIIICVADGWAHFKTMFYKYFKSTKTRKQADEACKKEGAQLVSIHSAD